MRATHTKKSCCVITLEPLTVGISDAKPDFLDGSFASSIKQEMISTPSNCAFEPEHAGTPKLVPRVQGPRWFWGCRQEADTPLRLPGGQGDACHSVMGKRAII